jgi:CheY-like chemotaxis protein
VVVLDVNLPSMRGDLLAAMIRKNARLSKVGLVLVSGVDGNSLESLAKTAGADAHVKKPHIRDKLRMAVMHAFNERR